MISPLNYPGNKARIVKEVLAELPDRISTFHDVFAGSGIVSVNSNAKKIVMNDISKEMIQLLHYMYSIDSQRIVQNMEKIIFDYNLTDSANLPKGTYIEYRHEGLSCYNRAGYLKLRSDYNKDKDIIKLFALIIFGFNHYIRFNSKGNFNVPVGKVDFSKSLIKKTIDFSNRIKDKDISFCSLDFRSNDLYSHIQVDDIMYFDPPYLVTNAPYNLQWKVSDEIDLLDLLDNLNDRKVKFLLSNVILSNGRENELLVEWSKKYNLVKVDRQYSNANYRRKNLSHTIEVLIKNF